MNIGPEDKYASILALLTMIAQCKEDTDIETIQQTAILAFTLVRDIKSVNQLKAA